MQTEFQRLSNGMAPLPGFTGTEPERDPLVGFALRWWWLLAIGVLLGIAAAVAYAKLGPVSYASTALIQVSANTGTDPTDNAGQARSAASNFAAEGMSTRMYDLVSQALPGTLDISAADLSAMGRSGQLDVRQQRGTNFIEVTVTDSDVGRAQLIANTFATVMVADVNERSMEQAQARTQELQGQIDFTRQQLAAAQLFDRERELDIELRDQQQHLLALQASYQQEQARRLEFDQLSGGQADESGVEGVHTDFERIMTEQIQGVEENIARISEELSEVRTLIGELPPDTDPLVSTAYASAYSSQLADLTSQFVQEQVVALAAGPPLIQYGDASTPHRVQSLKKLGFLGIAVGGAFAAGIAFLVDLLRQRRKKAGQHQSQVEAQFDLQGLLHELDQFQAIGSSNAKRAGSPDASKSGITR